MTITRLKNPGVIGEMIVEWSNETAERPKTAGELMDLANARGADMDVSDRSTDVKYIPLPSSKTGVVSVVIPDRDDIASNQFGSGDGGEYPLARQFDSAYTGQRVELDGDDLERFRMMIIGEYSTQKCGRSR
ncbi:MAG: hypothetical protein AAF870_05240 [Pseudomonadota bacterium]